MQESEERQADIDYIAEIGKDAELARAAFTHLAEPALIVDSQMRIIMVSAKVEIFLGYKPLELLGQKVEILVPLDKRSVHPQHTSRYMQFPQSRQMGSRIEGIAVRTKEGTELPARISLEPFVTSRGRYINVVMNLKDEVRGA